MGTARGLATGEVDANGKRTDLAYDPLGRLTSVWLPDRSKAGGASPSMKFDYLVRKSGPNAVGTYELRNNGSYTTSYALFDGLLRPRQTQTPGRNGQGRVLNDTTYDSRGFAVKSSGPYYDSAAVPGTSLFAASDVVIPSQTRTTFDGAGRPTVQALWSLNALKWSTTTAYGGDRVSVTPPAGGTATTTIVDGRGRASALRQYRGTTPTGAFDQTSYSYTPAGKLAVIVDPAGNSWRYGYDLRGRRVSTDDPDLGHGVSGYDNADQLTSSTDARGQIVAFDYAVTGDWVHLVGVFTAGARVLTLYVNGDNVAAASLTGTALPVAGVLAVGRGRVGGAAGSFWAGDVDEVHVFDGAIDSTRANQLYATTRP